MRPKIYLFGDSITEQAFSDGGWGASLAQHFCRTLDVVLRGYSGYNTRWALMVLDKVFPSPPESGSEAAPLCVTVLFGANDACLPDRYGAFQHVPIEEYKQNLHSIVSYIKKRWPSTHVILITPPPIDEEARLLHPCTENKKVLPERTNEAAGNYSKACLSVASECQIPAIDLWTKMQHFDGWKSGFLCDGLHLTPRGNRVVYEEVIEKLKQLGLRIEILPYDLPNLGILTQMIPLNLSQTEKSSVS